MGSNTTRLLVADVTTGALDALAADRRFTAVAEAIGPNGEIPPGKVAEVTEVVAQQAAMAAQLGVTHIRAVATAAIRDAANCSELVDAVAAACGVKLAILSGEEEARLAFAGAVGTLDDVPEGEVGVVDVGGGSTEVALGRARDGMSWFVSLAIGSGTLTRRHAASDPPANDELEAMRDDARAALAGVRGARPRHVFAVGGSATSLWALAGETLDEAGLRDALEAITVAPAEALGTRLGLDPRRVRLLPAGILILAAASEALGAPMSIGRGGLREGVLLAEAALAAGGSA
ncbi:MAG: exopolyphosphatase / guanosine-5-triphosphate,3-diphosphate pyrophosphatase [Solirubrobacteraceae bacterium]|nr:exopolyphosphatase / guanosine-5-triphosphate,3-diphosphate pyrophosphatase [Solirubrobacteraceae bacterium]